MAVRTSTNPLTNPLVNRSQDLTSPGLKVIALLSSGVARGGQGAWPPGASLGGGAGKKIRPRQIIKVTSLQCRINLAAKVAYAMGPALSRAPRSLWGLSFLFLAEDLFFFFFFFFCLSIFFPGGGGGADASIGPRALETLATPLLLSLSITT